MRIILSFFLLFFFEGYASSIKKHLNVFKYYLHALSGKLVHLPSSNADRYVQLIGVEDTPELAKKRP